MQTRYPCLGWCYRRRRIFIIRNNSNDTFFIVFVKSSVQSMKFLSLPLPSSLPSFLELCTILGAGDREIKTLFLVPKEPGIKGRCWDRMVFNKGPLMSSVCRASRRKCRKERLSVGDDPWTWMSFTERWSADRVQGERDGLWCFDILFNSERWWRTLKNLSRKMA